MAVEHGVDRSGTAGAAAAAAVAAAGGATSGRDLMDLLLTEMGGDPDADFLIFWDDSANSFAFNKTTTPIEAHLVIKADGTNSWGVAWAEAAGGSFVVGSAGVLMFLYSDGDFYFDNYETATSGDFVFRTSSSFSTQFKVVHTASAVNYLTVTGGPDPQTSSPLLMPAGSSTDVQIWYSTKGKSSHTFYTFSTGDLVFQLTDGTSGVGGAVNFIRVHNALTAVEPYILFTSTVDTNVGGKYVTKGSGTHYFATNSSVSTIQFAISHTASAVNYWQFTGSATSVRPAMQVTGSDTNIGLNVYSKGTGPIIFYSHSGSAPQFYIASVANAVNYPLVYGNATGNNPVISGTGSDTNVGISFYAQGAGGFYFYGDGGTTPQFAITRTASAVNYWQYTGAATNNPVTVDAEGTDAAVSMMFRPKGTNAWFYVVSDGAYNANFGLRYNNSAGNALNIEQTSTYSYLTNTSNNGFYFRAGSVIQFEIAYTASAVNYITVAGAASSLPYFLATGSATNISIGYYTKGTGSHYFYSGGGGLVSLIIDGVASSVNYARITPSATTNNVQLYLEGTDTDIGLDYSTKGSDSHQFWTNNRAQLQFAITHTASAVNYWNFTGNVTTGRPICRADGSDTNIGLAFYTKGTGDHLFYTGSTSPGSVLQFRISHTTSAVNYWSFTGGASGGVLSVTAMGSDTDIPMYVYPKGNGSFYVYGTGASQNPFVIDNGHGSTPYGVWLRFSGASPDDNTHYFMYNQDNTTLRAVNYADGDWYNHDNTYGAISDPKVKNNVTAANSQWNDTKNIARGMINYETKFSPGRRLLGVDSTAVRAISPGVVKKVKWGDEPGLTDVVDYMTLLVKGYRALGELLDYTDDIVKPWMTTVDEKLLNHETRIAANEADIAALKAA